MIQLLPAISLAPTTGDQLAAVTGMLGFVSGFEWFLTAFAVVSLALSVALFFWVSAGHRQTEQDLHQKLTESAATNARLSQKNGELAVADKELRQTIAGLHLKLEKATKNTASAAST